MSDYDAACPIRKHRCVTGANTTYVGGPLTVMPIESTLGPERQTFAGGKPVLRTENGFRVLAAPGLAIGIATQEATGPGQRVHVADQPGEGALAEAGEEFERESNLIADSEGRVIVARLGVRLSEPILAIAMERSAGSGRLVAVKLAPRGLRT